VSADPSLSICIHENMITRIPLQVAQSVLVTIIVAVLCGCDPPEDPQHSESAPTFGDLPSVEPADLSSLVSSAAYSKGDPSAPVTVIEFSDFACPVCAAFHRDDFPAIVREYIAQGVVRWNYVPVTLQASQSGIDASIAAMCVPSGPDGDIWEGIAVVYEGQRDWLSAADARPVLQQLLLGASSDDDSGATALYEECVSDRVPLRRLEEGNRVARRLGLRATPTFFIQGRYVPGRPPLHLMQSFLNEAASLAPMPSSEP
jgi:protein-disulfide isomerase